MGCPAESVIAIDDYETARFFENQGGLLVKVVFSLKVVFSQSSFY